MSKYTTEVRFICETAAGLTESAGFNSVEEILDDSWDKIFSFSFPIFDESYREPLCKKILRHFYTREIGMETVGLWKLRLDAKMNEIMPYYNDLYRAWAAEFNPLHDVDITRQHTLEKSSSTDGSQSGESETNSENMDAYSDTPQGALTNVENLEYLTSARKVTDETTNESSSTFESQYEGTDEFTESVTGKTGGRTYAKMLQEYKQALLNIDMMIIGELENLFMMIW